MGDRDSNNWVPIVAGVVVGAGIVALLYKMFFASRPEKPSPAVGIMNQQVGAPYKCTCRSGGSDPCQIHANKNKQKAEEERQRRCREQERRARGLSRRMLADEDPDAPPEPMFTPVQIALGSTGFLLGLMAFCLKFVMDQNTAHRILSKVGLGHLIPPRRAVIDPKDPCGGLRIIGKKRRWPVLKPEEKENY